MPTTNLQTIQEAAAAFAKAQQQQAEMGVNFAKMIAEYIGTIGKGNANNPWVTADKPSAILRKGMAITRPPWGQGWGSVGNSVVTHKKEVFACPMAAIYFGLHPEAVATAKAQGSLPYAAKANNAILQEVFDGNPVPKLTHPVTGEANVEFSSLIMDLRDQHKWGRRKIARFLEKNGL